MSNTDTDLRTDVMGVRYRQISVVSGRS
eukprot:COSAG01_NODE_54822_length_329_cov_1.017391_1_plen_27_part_10